jgi:hypothetical protein
MLYNMTGLWNGTNIVDYFSYIEFSVGIPIVELLIVLLWVVSFFSLKDYDNMKAFTASTFLAWITSVLFWLMGILNVDFVYGTSIMLGISILMIYFYNQ